MYFVRCALLLVHICSYFFLRAPKTESDFRCAEKARFTIIVIAIKICTTTPSTTTQIVNIDIGFIIGYYFYLVVVL